MGPIRVTSANLLQVDAGRGLGLTATVTVATLAAGRRRDPRASAIRFDFSAKATAPRAYQQME